MKKIGAILTVLISFTMGWYVCFISHREVKVIHNSKTDEIFISHPQLQIATREQGSPIEYDETGTFLIKNEIYKLFGKKVTFSKIDYDPFNGTKLLFNKPDPLDDKEIEFRQDVLKKIAESKDVNELDHYFGSVIQVDSSFENVKWQRIYWRSDHQGKILLQLLDKGNFRVIFQETKAHPQGSIYEIPVNDFH